MLEKSIENERDEANMRLNDLKEEIITIENTKMVDALAEKESRKEKVEI